MAVTDKVLSLTVSSTLAKMGMVWRRSTTPDYRLNRFEESVAQRFELHLSTCFLRSDLGYTKTNTVDVEAQPLWG